jgi:hypothetical protein
MVGDEESEAAQGANSRRGYIDKPGRSAEEIGNFMGGTI